MTGIWCSDSDGSVFEDQIAIGLIIKHSSKQLLFNEGSK